MCVLCVRDINIQRCRHVLEHSHIHILMQRLMYVKVWNIMVLNPNVPDLTPVAGSIFRPLSLTQKSGSEFSDEILRSALLDIQPTFKCPVKWIHVIPLPRL